MKEDMMNSRYDEGMRLECEVLHFSRGDERVYIANDGKNVWTYTKDGCIADRAPSTAIARLESLGYVINMQMVVRVPDHTQEAPNIRMTSTWLCGSMLKTEICTMPDTPDEDEQEEE